MAMFRGHCCDCIDQDRRDLSRLTLLALISCRLLFRRSLMSEEDGERGMNALIILHRVIVSFLSG